MGYKLKGAEGLINEQWVEIQSLRPLFRGFRFTLEVSLLSDICQTITPRLKPIVIQELCRPACYKV